MILDFKKDLLCTVTMSIPSELIWLPDIVLYNRPVQKLLFFDTQIRTQIPTLTSDRHQLTDGHLKV